VVPPAEDDVSGSSVVVLVPSVDASVVLVVVAVVVVAVTVVVDALVPDVSLELASALAASPPPHAVIVATRALPRNDRTRTHRRTLASRMLERIAWPAAPRRRFGWVVRAFAWSLVIGGAAATLQPPVAHAGDGIRPRTPVVWPADVPCMVTVDRGVDPVVNLPYSIALEDPIAGESITDDEVVDGRRHQFLAFRSDIDPRVAMPEWIAWADVTAAAALGLVDPAIVPDDRVLDTHPVLGTEVVRIDADDARRPITFDAADAGADWDTSTVAAGTWVVRAYTWDPWPNRWALPRRGAVRVVDDATMPIVAPALSVAMDPPILHRDEVGMIDGCIVADEGTVLSAAWADATDPAAPFVDFANDVPVEGDAIAIEFAPPEALWGKFAVLRVSATDPDGRRYDAFVADRITVLATDAGGECEDGGGFVMGCGSSSGDPMSGEASVGTTAVDDSGGTTTTIGTTTTTTTTTTGASEATTSADAVPAQAGCGCASGAPRGFPYLLAIAGLVARRRFGGRRDRPRRPSHISTPC